MTETTEDRSAAAAAGPVLAGCLRGSEGDRREVRAIGKGAPGGAGGGKLANVTFGCRVRSDEDSGRSDEDSEDQMKIPKIPKIKEGRGS